MRLQPVYDALVPFMVHLFLFDLHLYGQLSIDHFRLKCPVGGLLFFLIFLIFLINIGIRVGFETFLAKYFGHVSFLTRSAPRELLLLSF